MKCRVLLIAWAIAMMATSGFSQPQDATFAVDYPGDWECGSHSPLTFGSCWTGTAIPDGAVINVLKNGSLHTTWNMNSEFVCGSPVGGFFSTNYFQNYLAGDRAQLDIVYQGCHYYTAEYVLVVGDNYFALTEAAWTCSCTNPGCEVKEEQGGLLPSRAMEPAEGESDGLSDSGSGLGSAASSTDR